MTYNLWLDSPEDETAVAATKQILSDAAEHGITPEEIIQATLDLPPDDPYLDAVRMHSQLADKRHTLMKLLDVKAQLKDTCDDMKPYLEARPWKEPASLEQMKASICTDPLLPAVTAVKDPPSFVKAPISPPVSTVKVKQLQAETKPVKHGFWNRLLALFRGTKPEGDYKKT